MPLPASYCSINFVYGAACQAATRIYEKSINVLACMMLKEVSLETIDEGNTAKTLLYGLAHIE